MHMRSAKLLLCTVILLLLSLPVLAADPVTERVSVDSAGTEGNHNSIQGSVSADGRYVAFRSRASNLAVGDTSPWTNIFVHDRQTRTTTVVSINSDGSVGNQESMSPSISWDGRLIAFASWATNLVAGDTNQKKDIFVHDRQTGATSRISVDSNGAQTNRWSAKPAISGDGRFVAFCSWASNLIENDTNFTFDIFVHDRQTVTTSRVSVSSEGIEGKYESVSPSISSDGRFVAFASKATLTEDDNNTREDVYLHDRETGTTMRASVKSKDEDPPEPYSMDYFISTPSVSGDGRYVAFVSAAVNLIGPTNTKAEMFIKDMETGILDRIDFGNGPIGIDPAKSLNGISANGNYLVFNSPSTDLVANDTNGFIDVFIRGPLLPAPPPRPQIFIPAIPKLLLLSKSTH